MFNLVPKGRTNGSLLRNGLFDSFFDDIRHDILDGIRNPLLNASSLVSTLNDPVVELSETDSEHIARLELPGVSSDEIDVEFVGDTLTVKLNRKSTKEDKNLFASRVENFTTRRTIKNVKADGIVAEMKNGVLIVTLPKAENSVVTKIKVNGE